MKKFLFSMICTLLPILASAQLQDEELTPYAVLSDDHTVLTFFYDNDKESQGGMDVGPFTSADERGWNEYCESIEQVVFVEAFAGCEAITSTRYWFQNFTNLTTIIGLGNLKTNHVTDMGSMFAVCSSLTNLDLNGFDTSNATDMAHMFAGCSSLTSLDLSGFITSNVTDMALMFSGCSGLTSLDLGDFNTSNVTTMWAMFNGCSNLTNLDVSEFDTSNATNMSAMFEDCSGLTSLDVSNFNTDNVTNMGNMFNGCSNLESLDVSNFNTANVTNMGSMFGGCSKLTTLDLSGFDTSSATDLGHMFALCSGLTSLDVTGFNTSNATNMVCMFEGCSGLTSLDVSNFDTSNATNLSSMFILCSGLTSLDVSGFNTSNATDLSSMFAGCSGLTSLDVSGSFDTSNATNLSAMFEDCSSLTNLDLSGFNTANATNLSSMFIRCSGLTSLDVSNFNTANVTDMGNMFDGCSKLVSLDVSGLNTENVTNMGYMFSDCLKLTSPLDVSEFNTANVVRMDYMFNHCESLTALDVSNFNTANVTTMGSMFNYCSNLESLDVSNFNTEKVTYMAWMFADCSNLTSLDVSNFNTTNVTDMGAMFTSCSGLTELDLSNFDTSNTTTLELFFNKCSGLTSLDLSNFNTANVKNMDSMFSQCSGLETISTGNEWSTENIESGAGMFIGCTALVGGAGTTYNANHVDYTYARIDGGATNPGYLTDPNQPLPYAVLNEDNTILTFYYDNQKTARGGMSVGPFTLDLSNKTVNSGWDEVRENIQQVVFNESFANCTTITSTSCWFYGFTNLTSFKDLENLKTDNVTDMSCMFWGCSSLTSLDVSNFNTSNVTDMNYMFAACESLASLELGDNFNTSNVTDMTSMFGACESLTSIDVSNFNTANVTNMGSMFSGCSGLSSLDVTGFDTSKAIYMSSMFWGCSSLTSLDVTGFDTSNATDLSGMFNGCSGLTSLDVSGFDTSKATTLEIMFGSCESLTSLDLSNFNTSNVTRMWKMFSGCSNLTNLNVSGFNTSNVTVMTAMFEDCSSLTNLDLSSFNTSNATTMYQMFYHCSGLETIYVGNEWSTESIESGDNMFTGCTALVGGAGTTYDPDHVNVDYAHIDGGSSNPGYLSGSGQAVPYAVLNEDNSVLTFYYDDQKAARGGMDVGPFDDGGKKNGSGWSEVNEEITTVVFDDSFANCTTLTSTAYWFYGCENLTTIKNFSNLKTDNVIDINSMFHDCHSLKSIDFSSLNLSKVTNMHQVFEDCRTLESVNFSGVNTENVTDMSDLFLNCHNLKTIDISSFNTKNVTKMTSMFYKCDVLTTIYVGEEWTTENVTESESMFRESPNLVGGRGTTYDANHVDIEYAHIDGGTSNPGYLTDINGASEETWAKLQSRIEYGTDVLSKAKEISSVDQALIEKLDEALQNANQMYKIHEASEDEVLHMIEVLNERINDVEEAMNQPASDETWTELKATIEYGTDVLSKAKEISTIDQWLIEELDMTLDSGNQMYKIHEASEEEVLNMIDELNWRIREVEEAMKQPASDEAWAELHEAVEAGEKLQIEAKDVSTVEPWALEELENMTAKGSEMYKVHTAGEEEVRHMTEELNQIINEVEEMMRQQPQPQPQGEALFDGLTAWVSGSYTLDDAFEDIGGRSEAAKTIAAIVWNADGALTADMLSGIDNPNLLVFVTEASKAPSGVQNVVIDGVAAEIVLTDATGNNNFYCPQSFTAKSISYSRDFSQTTEIDVCRGWETIALPFDVQSITHESHGALVPFGGSDNGYPFWLRQLSTNGLARATKIEANRPYLICMPNNIIYPPEYNQNGTVTFSSSNVTVPVTSARSVSGAGVTFHATFQQVTKSSSVYALNVGETRGEYPEGSVFEQNYRDIRPFQAYTTHSAGTRSFITLESLGGNDDATGIEELRIKNSEFGDAEGVWYSLDGRRLDVKPTKKGVYVKDGRKIVIK